MFNIVHGGAIMTKNKIKVLKIAVTKFKTMFHKTEKYKKTKCICIHKNNLNNNKIK